MCMCFVHVCMWVHVCVVCACECVHVLCVHVLCVHVSVCMCL